MGEQLRKSYDHGSSPEQDVPHRESPKNSEKLSSADHEQPTHTDESIKKITKKIETHARASAEIDRHLKHDQLDDRPASYHSPYKGYVASQTLIKAQKQLNTTERQFSKIVHNKNVETASDIVGNTIARPSGLLLGGFLSLIASVTVLIICRFYGYEYNFLIGMVCFIGGFAAGLIIELIIKTTQKTRRN